VLSRQSAARGDDILALARPFLYRRSKNNRVRVFAPLMVQDHTAGATGFKPQRRGGTFLISSISATSSTLQQLQRASGADFERHYVQHQLGRAGGPQQRSRGLSRRRLPS
jgi:predicted outer membrane protein